MAGKHWNTTGANQAARGALPAIFPGSKIDKAYSEGRGVGQAGGDVGDNPQEANSAAWNAWRSGFFGQASADNQMQTAYP
jgi:hypothetical protein